MEGAGQMEDQEHIRNKMINEEYKIWKKNSVFLYDVMYSRALEWPTLTTQWLPDVTNIPDTDFRTHRLLLGTHTSDQSSEYLQFAQITLPNPPAGEPEEAYEEKDELGGHDPAKKQIQFTIVQKILHPCEINKARYQPQNPDIIATWSPDSNVYVWDRTKHPSVPRDVSAPQIILCGHDKEGFALEWSPQVEGQLLTGSEDKTVRIWDLQRDFSLDDSVVHPSRTLTHHCSSVNDVQYHPTFGTNLLGSVSDDLTIQIMDLRSASATRAAIRFAHAHTDAINSLSFHPTLDKLLATGSADRTIGVFDLRFAAHGRLHSLEGHYDAVSKVAWHPTDAAVLASSAEDRRVVFWDLSRAGAEQTPEDAEDGPPEMLFMHGGHTNRVSDFDWNLNDPWVMCSAAEDNLIQVWRASRHLVEQTPTGVRKRDVSES